MNIKELVLNKDITLLEKAGLKHLQRNVDIIDFIEKIKIIHPNWKWEAVISEAAEKFKLSTHAIICIMQKMKKDL